MRADLAGFNPQAWEGDHSAASCLRRWRGEVDWLQHAAHPPQQPNLEPTPQTIYQRLTHPSLYCSYNLPVVVLVFNNGGIYGGERRPAAVVAAAAAGAAAAGFAADPAPTAFVPGARYAQIMAAFGGGAYEARSASELTAACHAAFGAAVPALIDVAIDPLAGVESGTVHAFNAPKSKL